MRATLRNPSIQPNRLPLLLTILTLLTPSCGLYVSPKIRDAQNALQTAIATQDRTAIANALRTIEQLNALRPDQVEFLNRTKTAQTLAADICAAADAGDGRKALAILGQIEALSLPLTSSEKQIQSRATFTLQTQPEIDLATKTSDVDKLFVLLQRQRDSGLFSQEQQKLLEAASDTLKDLHEMRNAKSDHNHELAVQAADRVLDRFPDNTEARRTFQESGLLFSYLQTALISLRSLQAVEQSAPKTYDAKESDDAGTTLGKVKARAQALADADRALTAAIALDPHFTKSIMLHQYANAAQNILTELACSSITDVLTQCLNAADSVCVRVFNTVNDSINNRSRYDTRAPWDIFSPYNSAVSVTLAQTHEIVSAIAEYTSVLRSIRNESNKDLIDAATAYAIDSPKIVRLLLSTDGLSWKAYSSNIESGEELARRHRDLISVAKSAVDSVIHESTKTFIGIQSYDCFDKPETLRPILEKRKNLIIGA